LGNTEGLHTRQKGGIRLLEDNRKAIRQDRFCCPSAMQCGVARGPKHTRCAPRRPALQADRSAEPPADHANPGRRFAIGSRGRFRKPQPAAPGERSARMRESPPPRSTGPNTPPAERAGRPAPGATGRSAGATKGLYGPRVRHHLRARPRDAVSPGPSHDDLLRIHVRKQLSFTPADRFSKAFSSVFCFWVAATPGLSHGLGLVSRPPAGTRAPWSRPAAHGHLTCKGAPPGHCDHCSAATC